MYENILEEVDMITVSMFISAIAAALIAYFTWQNYNMYKLIQDRDEQYKKQTHDLYQAIVISTLLSGPSSYGQFGQCKDEFKRHYTGETKIFND